jgi:two-component system sensor histidine kinase/response regulator
MIKRPDTTDEESGKGTMSSNSESVHAFDEAAALERIGGDRGLLAEIAALFSQEYPELVKSIHAGLAAGDTTVVERSAHSLKGSASNFGAYACVEAALDIERQAKNGALERVPDLLEILEARLAVLHRELAALNPKA